MGGLRLACPACVLRSCSGTRLLNQSIVPPLISASAAPTLSDCISQPTINYCPRFHILCVKPIIGPDFTSLHFFLVEIVSLTHTHTHTHTYTHREHIDKPSLFAIQNGVTANRNQACLSACFLAGQIDMMHSNTTQNHSRTAPLSAKKG